jgi:translation initiation factor IF-3
MVNADPRINGRVAAPEVRVVAEDGSDLGIYALADALQLAQARSLDLIEIAPTEQPPRCILMDYGRFRYQQQQKKTEGDATQTI